MLATQRPQRASQMQIDRSDGSARWDGQASPEESEVVEEFHQDSQEFARAFDALSVSRKSPAEKRAEIFRVVEFYYKYAARKARALRRSQGQSSDSAQRRLDDASSQDSMDLDEAENGAQSPYSSAMLSHWQQEAQTWDILRRLLPLRYSNRNAAKPIRREISRFQSSSDLWDEFLESDPIAKERRAILECLQASADESGADIDELVREYQQRAERGDIIAYGWLHTRSAIKMQKNINGWSGTLDPNSADVGQVLVDANGSNPLVTQLDPDVATRQNRKLQPQDEYFERAIWLGCYELLRRGRSISEIRDWCVERTEVWRAVSMSAMPLSKEEGEDRFSGDPLSTLLWRRTCYALARQGGTDDYERAVYGILSGDIPSVEKVCKDWDDYVYASYNALLRSQFDAYLTNRLSPDATATITQAFSSFNAVQFHGDAATIGERLVSFLESDLKTSAQAKTPMKALQAAILSNNLSQYIYELGAVLGKRANEKETSALIPEMKNANINASDTKFPQLHDHRGLRVTAHIFLLISSLDELQGGGHTDLELREAQENVVSAYVSTLRLTRMTDLLPLYCARLQGERALFTLSRNILGVVDPSDREILLKIMTKAGIDTAKFIESQPVSLLQEAGDLGGSPPAFGSFTVFSKESSTLKYGRPLKPDFFGDEPEFLDVTDAKLIESLEWFLLDDRLWDGFFKAGTAIYKRLLLRFDLHTARALSECVQCAEMFRKRAGIAIPDDTDVSWFDEVSAGAANDSFKDYGIGPAEVAAARNFFDMECLVRALDSMETVASSIPLTQDPTSEPGKDFWSHVGGEVKKVKSFMRPILTNWLLESIDDDPDFGYLRDAYLPEIVIGYVSVLHFAGTSLSRDNLLECMELASIIAKKDSDVAAALMKSGRMKEIVEGFANCSKALAISANEKKGSGGSSKRMRELGWTRELWSVKR